MIFTLRIWGLSHSYAPLEHDFLKLTPPVIVKVIPLKAPLSEDKIKTFLSFLKPSPISHFTKKTHPIIKKKPTPGDTHLTEKPNTHTPQRQKSFLVLDLKTKDPARWLSFIKFIEKYKLEKKLILTSPYPQVLELIKKEKPLMVYALSLTQFTQLTLLTSLFLESIAPIKADVIIAPLKIRNTPFLTPRLVKELNRRHKKIILQNISAFNNAPDWLKPHVYGWLTMNEVK